MTTKELVEYANACGIEAAADLLILGGPDNYDGDFDATLKKLNDIIIKRIESEA